MKFPADAELSLLTDWHDAAYRPRVGRAAVGSILVHLLLFSGAVGLANLDTGRSDEPVAPPPVRNVTHLVLPPSLLTQTAPNQAKVAKEVRLENLLAKPRPVFRAPAPAAQTFTKPTSPVLADPPRIEAEQRAPVIPRQGNPNITIAPPPAPTPAPEKNPVFAKIVPPKTGVQEAIRSVVHGGGEGGGMTVGDMETPPSLADAMRQSSAPPHNGSSLELLSDPRGVDFKPYLVQVLASVRRNWFAVMPESAHMGRRGHVLIQFAIARNGTVPKLVIVMPSGAEALDRAAVAGISASNPFQPLPGNFTGAEIRLQLSFQYNMPKN